MRKHREVIAEEELNRQEELMRQATNGVPPEREPPPAHTVRASTGHIPPRTLPPYPNLRRTTSSDRPVRAFHVIRDEYEIAQKDLLAAVNRLKTTVRMTLKLAGQPESGIKLPPSIVESLQEELDRIDSVS